MKTKSVKKGGRWTHSNDKILCEKISDQLKKKESENRMKQIWSGSVIVRLSIFLHLF